MKKYVSTIIFISIIVISVLMGVRQYKNDESLKSKENEPQTEVSWATPWGMATMKKVADLKETESYDTTKSFYKDYDDTGLETCILTGIFADSEEEAIKQVRETGHCRYAYMTEDGKCEIKLTEEEKTWWIDSAKKTVDKIIEKNVDNEGYTFVLSEDYKELQVFANKDGKLSQFQADITNLVYAIEIIQLFSGADDWNVVITVTNTENGVEIAKANCPKEELIIEPEMWDE